ncbi:MAG: hypothetical protein KGD63_13765 [Candidatus Lokiarchaeota archaeon]|nr:hypothetical protein [Candidatus Lokiarchaeota archaeon]
MNQFELNDENYNLEFTTGDSLKIISDFKFYHNKLKFRKELNILQYLFKKYLGNPLQAAGIRDTYLNENNTESFYILFFSTYEAIKKLNGIMNNYLDLNIEKGCFFIESKSEYMILLSKDEEGIIAGIHTMDNILDQILDDYFQKKKFEGYIEIFPFKLSKQ